MKPKYKSFILTLAFFTPLLLVALLVFVKGRGLSEGDSDNPGRARIDAMIKALKKESLEESMDMLIKDDPEKSVEGNWSLYFAVTRLNSQSDLEVALSGRRAIKVLQSIKKLSRKDRATKCDQLFSKALQTHSNAICTVLKHPTDPSSPKNPSSAKNRQSTWATKIAMCTAMFTTADVGRRDLLARQFVRLDEFRSAVEPRFTARNIKLLFNMTPDNRFQVNVLRLAAVRADDDARLKRVDAECALAKMKASEIPIVAWDARATWFDQIGLMRAKMDTRKGVSNYTVYDWASLSQPGKKNEQQESLVRKLRSIVLDRP